MTERDDIMAVRMSGRANEIADGALRRRSFWASAEGLVELRDILVSSGVFSRIEPDDRERMGQRDMALSILDSMALLTEGSIVRMLAFLMGDTEAIDEMREAIDGQ